MRFTRRGCERDITIFSLLAPLDASRHVLNQVAQLHLAAQNTYLQRVDLVLLLVALLPLPVGQIVRGVGEVAQLTNHSKNEYDTVNVIILTLMLTEEIVIASFVLIKYKGSTH